MLLNNLLNLKVTCFKTEICKVRFPINSLEKYTDLIQQKEYSYIVYYFDKEKSNLEIYIGKNKNEIKEGRLTMNLCILLERIISKIDFKFIITGRNVSMAIFKLEVNKNSNVIVKWKL